MTPDLTQLKALAEAAISAKAALSAAVRAGVPADEGQLLVYVAQAAESDYKSATTEPVVLALLEDVARLREENAESNAVCACGCIDDAHDDYGEDGLVCEQSCGADCVRTSRSVLGMLESLRHIIAEYQPRLVAAEAALTAERQKAQALREKVEKEAASDVDLDSFDGGYTAACVWVKTEMDNIDRALPAESPKDVQ